MKILFFTDIHITSTTPIGRSDDYTSKISSKLDEIVKRSSEVDVILNAGDIFHRAKPNLQEISILVDFSMRLECPMYACAGNHDLIGYNYERLRDTGIGLSSRFLKNIHLITPSENYIKLGEGVHLHHVGMNTTGVVSDFFVDRLEGANIGLIHDMLVEEPHFEDHVLLKDFSTNLDLVFSGHSHMGYKTQKVNGRGFINPGSMMRMTRKKEDMERIPKYVMLDISPKQWKVLEEVPFQAYEANVFNENIEEEIQPFFDSIDTSQAIGISAIEFLEQRAEEMLSEEAKIKFLELRRSVEL